MSNDATVNSQIVDSVTGLVTLLAGQSAASAMGMLDVVMTETLGMSMHNAVTRQQNNHMTSSAAITAACAKMLQVPFGRPAPAPLLPLKDPNGGGLPNPPDAASAIARSYVDAEAAVAALRREASAAGRNVATAEKDLQNIVTQATPPTPQTKT